MGAAQHTADGLAAGDPAARSVTGALPQAGDGQHDRDLTYLDRRDTERAGNNAWIGLA